MADADGENSGQEKKYEATEHRKNKAREDGQVARAPDASKLALVVIMALLLVPGSLLISGPIRWVAAILAHAATLTVSSALHDAFEFLAGMAGLSLALAFIASMAGMVPGGWSLSMKPVAPDVGRLDPAKGLKNLLGAKQWIEALKALLKFILIGAAGVLTLWHWKSRILALPHGVLPDWTLGLEAVAWIFTACVATAAALTILDVPTQAWLHRRKLRMTEQEMRDEQKETDVKPEVRRKLKEAAARAARARMMDRLPEASVVAVNPTHYAVALRYRRGKDAAPLVIATGAGQLAGRIREIARGHGVPVVLAPPLARALYFHSQPGELVPSALYRACAEVLAYVWRLEAWAEGSGLRPQAPTDDDLAVDPKLDPETRRH